MQLYNTDLFYLSSCPPYLIICQIFSKFKYTLQNYMCPKRSFKLIKVLVVAFQNSENISMICNYNITKAEIIPYMK